MILVFTHFTSFTPVPLFFRKTRERKALKVISYENVIGKEELIRSEIAIMRRISHEFIVQMHDCWEFEGSFYLSLELITVITIFFSFFPFSKPSPSTIYSGKLDSSNRDMLIVKR